METICAISTPQGIGGIAVIRVSGTDAISIVEKIFHSKRILHDLPAYSACFGKIEQEGEVLDEAVALLFRAPHSFTGEDIVELSVHGSQYIQRTLLEWLIDNGCRLAQAGEFTQRAFLNGKMDLSQAEAVADIIASENKNAHAMALKQLKGSVTTELQRLRDQLLHFTTLIELELDFADHEELEFADRTELKQLAQQISKHIDRLTSTFKTGNAIKNGIPVAIIGKTNVGKSTLLNALVGEERAIVSDIDGTTRDTIDDTVTIGGTLFRFIDTAGIRNTDNTIESLGIERSKQEAQKASIILLVQDATQSERLTLDDIDTTDKQIINIYNKADLLSDIPQELEPNSIYLSAKNQQIGELKDILLRFAPQVNSSDVLISNARHYEALQKAQTAIGKVIEGLDNSLSGELLSLDLQDCLNALGEITGQITSEEVLHSVFSKFCIGK